MRLDVVASERHYADHLAPIWHGLDPSERGRWYVARASHRHVIDRLGVPASAVRQATPDRSSAAPVLVGSFRDLRNVRPRPAVMVNHGAGQTYDGDRRSAGHPSYSGGRQRGTVVLNLCPGPRDLAIVTAAQPDVPSVVVGCPKLDPWHSVPHCHTQPPMVALSFHADITVCPEARWAFPHYEHALPALAQDPRWQLMGHGHPRAWPRLRRVYAEAGIEPVEHFDQVLDRASLYVVDNSSTAYEFASTGRPVLLLNAPWYRRDVDHGLRFWDLAPGDQVDGPDGLPDAIAATLADPGATAGLRRAATDAVYAAADGHATARAVDAIRTHVLRGNRAQPQGPAGRPPSRRPDRSHRNHRRR